MNKKIGRNESCPCGSGKKYKKCCISSKQTSVKLFSWMDKKGAHVVAPGEKPTPEQLKKMTENYQKEIRNSPMWEAMVKKFGQGKAEELLKQCKVKIG